jgi:hypothetical protein
MDHGQGRLGGGVESFRQARDPEIRICRLNGTDVEVDATPLILALVQFCHQLFSLYTRNESLSMGNAGVETRVT